MTRLLAVIGIAVALAAASIAGADPRNVFVLGTKSASGRKAHGLAVAGGTHPEAFKKVTLEVAAKPRQRVNAGWAAVCQAGGSVTYRDARTVRGRTPLSTEIVLVPADSCNISADATLAGKGRLTVQVVGRR